MPQGSGQDKHNICLSTHTIWGIIFRAQLLPSQGTGTKGFLESFTRQDLRRLPVLSCTFAEGSINPRLKVEAGTRVTPRDNAQLLNTADIFEPANWSIPMTERASLYKTKPGAAQHCQSKAPMCAPAFITNIVPKCLNWWEILATSRQMH